MYKHYAMLIVTQYPASQLIYIFSNSNRMKNEMNIFWNIDLSRGKNATLCQINHSSEVKDYTPLYWFILHGRMAHTVEYGKIRRNRLLSSSCKRSIHVYLRSLLDKYDLSSRIHNSFHSYRTIACGFRAKKERDKRRRVFYLSDIAEPKISERCDKITYLVNKRV